MPVGGSSRNGKQSPKCGIYGLGIGEARATSGSSKMRFRSRSKLCGILPDGCLQKVVLRAFSGSGGLRVRFLAGFSFMSGCPAGTNQSNLLSSSSMHDRYQPADPRSFDNDKAILVRRVIGIGDRDGERISEDGGCLVEATRCLPMFSAYGTSNRPTLCQLVGCVIAGWFRSPF
jgi:hypothetical protein